MDYIFFVPLFYYLTSLMIFSPYCYSAREDQQSEFSVYQIQQIETTVHQSQQALLNG